MAGSPEGRVFHRPGTEKLWIAYYVDGIEYRESSGSPDKRAAEALLKLRIAEKSASRVGLIDFVGPQRLTIDALLDGLIDDYRVRGRKSLAKTHSHIQPLRRLLDGCLAVEVDSAKVRWYIGQRLDEGRSHAKINRELAALRRAFNLARQDGRVRQVPHFPMLAEHNIRRGFFELSEAERVIRFLPDYLQDLVRFAFWTGWRLSEVTGLQWEMIDLAQRTITLPDSKNNGGRVLALEGDLLAIIERRHAEREVGPWVFHHMGRPIHTFYKAWRNACEGAGVPGKRLHDFRRTTVRNLTRVGVPEKVAMDLTGHKTRSIWDRYNITSGEDLREAAKKLQTFVDTVRFSWQNSAESCG